MSASSRFSKQFKEFFYSGASIESSSRNKNWNGLLFTQYSTTRTSSESTYTPASNSHRISFLHSGSAVGENRFCDEDWDPFEWRVGECSIEPEQQNQKDCHWKILDEAAGPISVSILQLDTKLLKKHALESVGKDSVELIRKVSVNDPLLYQLVQQLSHEANASSPFELMMVQSAMALLSVHLLKNYCNLNVKIPEYSDKPNNFEKVLKYIENHVHQDLTLDTLASISDMSVYHFSRTFKKAVGKTPHQYVKEARVKYAERLLQDTNKPIAEIASELGYSVSHFTHAFRTIVGCTPREYRKKNLKLIVL